MRSIKQEALDIISKLPEEVSLDEIIYKLYVIEKIRKGREAVQNKEVIASNELKKEIESW